MTDEEWLDGQTQRQINYYRRLHSAENHADRALRIELTKPALADKALNVGEMLAARIFEMVRSNMGAYVVRTQELITVIASGQPIDNMEATLQLRRAIDMMKRYLEQGPRVAQAQLVDDTEDEDEDTDEEALPTLYVRPSEDVVGPRVADAIDACGEALLHAVNLWYQDAYQKFQEWGQRHDAYVRIKAHRAICTQLRMAARLRQRVLDGSGMGLEDAVQEDVEQIERMVSGRERDLDRVGT